jgi:hypothetical protein
LLLVALVACGGDDDSPDGTATSDVSSGDGTPAGTLTPDGTPTETPETPIATPTRVADTDPLMVVNYGATLLQPTAADLAALPQVEVEGLDGETYSGVTLNDLAAAVGAAADGFVEVQGIRSDGVRLTTVRYSLAESGADTVVFVGESGNVNVASASVPLANWLSAVQAIAYL